MNQLALTIVSLFALSVAASLAARVLRLSVCPVCAGVAGTWLSLLTAREIGNFAVDPLILAILLGASAVGVAQSVTSRLAEGRSPQFWKALMLAGGFALAYALSAGHWLLAGVSAAQLSLTAALALRRQSAPARDGQAVALLEERMKQCC
jgi:hypothetical protein